MEAPDRFREATVHATMMAVEEADIMEALLDTTVEAAVAQALPTGQTLQRKSEFATETAWL